MTDNDLTEIRALRSELNACATEMASLRSCFSTWQTTRCQDHHDRMEAIEVKYGQLELAQTKIIAKSAGIVAAVVGIVNVLTVVLGVIALKGHLGG